MDWRHQYSPRKKKDGKEEEEEKKDKKKKRKTKDTPSLGNPWPIIFAMKKW